MVTLVNRAKMSTSTTGTGTITLGSAETGYQSFADAGVADGDVIRYVIEDGDDWEIGSGTYTATGTTLTRTVDESSNSDAALNLTGSAVVFITAAAGDVAGADRPLDLSDNTKLRFGDGFDLELYSDGTQSYIKENNSSGHLNFLAQEMKFNNASGTRLMTLSGTQVELLHNGSKKLETTTTGLQTTGTVNVNGAYTLPTSDGTNGQVLTTDGAGAVTFADAGGGATDINGLSDAVADSGQKNYGLGTLSGTSYDSLNGYRNTAYGYSSGQSITTGDDNTVIGNDAGKYITTGINNTAIGSNALEALSTNNLTGSSNTAVGYNAGSSLRGTAQSNVLIGSDAGNLLQTGNYNVNIGRNASAGSANIKTVAIGYVTYANADNATSINNSYASGDAAFAANITNNTSSYGASGANSVALGYQAKATGQYAFATGYQAIASDNSAIAMGFSADATGSSSVSIGYSNTASALNSVAIGRLSTASANYACAIGNGATASSTNAFAFGDSSTASGFRSIALGRSSTQGISGKHSRGAYIFSSVGDAQEGKYVLLSDTTDATAEALTTTNGAASTTNQVILPNNSAYSFSGTIIARQDATSGSDYASWEIKGALLRDANAASTVLGNGIVNKLYATSGASTWAVALSADTTNGGLKVEVTGAAATNIRWVATVNTSEVTYA